MSSCIVCLSVLCSFMKIHRVQTCVFERKNYHRPQHLPDNLFLFFSLIDCFDFVWIHAGCVSKKNSKGCLTCLDPCI